MPEFFLELFSEEIPARMQARAAEDLTRLCVEALAPLTPGKLRSFHGPRRIALAADVAEFFSTMHSLKGDAGRSWAWAGVAEMVRRKTEARLGEAVS